MSIQIGIDDQVIELKGKAAAEFEAQRAADQKVIDDAEAKSVAKKAAKMELYAKLGLTDDEANLLGL